MTLDAKKFQGLPIPDKLTLCLAWTRRNVDARPMLGELIEDICREVRLGDNLSNAR